VNKCKHENTISIYEDDGRDLFRCCQCGWVCGSDREWREPKPGWKPWAFRLGWRLAAWLDHKPNDRSQTLRGKDD